MANKDASAFFFCLLEAALMPELNATLTAKLKAALTVNYQDLIAGNKDYRASYFCRAVFGTCTCTYLIRNLHLLIHNIKSC